MSIWLLDIFRWVNAVIALASIPACVFAAFLRPRPYSERMILLGLVGYGLLIAWAYLRGLGTPGLPGVEWRLPLFMMVTNVSTIGVMIHAVREWNRLQAGRSGKT